MKDLPLGSSTTCRRESLEPDDVCRVCECYRGGIVVMYVFWRRLCESIL